MAKRVTFIMRLRLIKVLFYVPVHILDAIYYCIKMPKPNGVLNCFIIIALGWMIYIIRYDYAINVIFRSIPPHCVHV